MSNSDSSCVSIKFQFPNGSIKSCAGMDSTAYTYKFQFPNGSIKSTEATNLRDNLREVSIP